MAVSFDDEQHAEIEELVTDTISSLEGVVSIMTEFDEQEASASMHAQFHALRDVLVVCQSRLETAASMLDV